jgi:uncharacterized membrane-anchored protein YhcB (DUF1043 family)
LKCTVDGDSYKIEWTLRVASLVVGLIVGIMSLVSMIKKIRER